MSVDRCVMCGEIIPEGRQVCPDCQRRVNEGDGPYCWLCGRNGSGDPLDTHHIFGGANRSKSDRYGLTVKLCHSRCHIFGKYAVHHNADTMRELHEYGQRLAMARYGWSVDDFRKEFGKNYLEE